MRRLHLREYKPDDFLNIDAHESEKRTRKDLPVESFAHYHKIAGPAGTVLSDEGDIIACFGISILWPGTGEAWFVVCRHPERYIRLLQICHSGLEIAKKNHELKRIQAIVDPAREEAIRFVTHLGFEFEARMKKYGPKGVDKCMYALTEE